MTGNETERWGRGETEKSRIIFSVFGRFDRKSWCRNKVSPIRRISLSPIQLQYDSEAVPLEI